MIRLKIIVIILVLSFSFLHLNYVLGDKISSCQLHNICVHPGDYIIYEIISGQTNSSETYSFGDTIDSDIKVNETYFGESKIQNTAFILNLKTGYGHNIQENSTAIPFLMILPTPIQYNQSDISISKESKNFNGFNRTTISATRISDSGTLFMEYDIQTGILVSAHSIEVTKQSEKPITLEYSYDLVDTNIINSDSVKNTMSIPAWIKNTAGWWASGTIDDTRFVKAIQYLISNNIIQIPHGLSGNSSSQEIPVWIKSNAKWWAQGKISDYDFISGIQYLINSGTVQV